MDMTEHLPECWAKHESDPEAWCICDELRACEARIIAAAVQRMEALWALDPSWDGTNWNNALTSALSAINAPKEER